jgi:hypothetical protein
VKEALAQYGYPQVAVEQARHRPLKHCDETARSRSARSNRFDLRRLTEGGQAGGAADRGDMPFDPTFLSNFVPVSRPSAARAPAALWIALRSGPTVTSGRSHSVQTYRRYSGGPLPGVLVYLILRPTRTLEYEHQHTLDE